MSDASEEMPEVWVDTPDDAPSYQDAYEWETVGEDDHMASCIWIDPGRQSGQPCLGGTRIPVACIAWLPDESVRDWYPDATEDHIKAVRWWLKQPGVEAYLKASL